MFVHCHDHASAFTLAKLLVPEGKWLAASGDVGQCTDEDVGLEDKTSEATIVLHSDGTATFSHHLLTCVTTHCAPSKNVDEE